MLSCNSVHDSRFSELSNSSRFQNCVQFYPRTSDHPVTGHTRSSLLTAYLLGEFRFLNSQAHKRSIISASALSFFRYLLYISHNQLNGPSPRIYHTWPRVRVGLLTCDCLSSSFTCLNSSTRVWPVTGWSEVRG